MELIINKLNEIEIKKRKCLDRNQITYFRKLYNKEMYYVNLSIINGRIENFINRSLFINKYPFLKNVFEFKIKNDNSLLIKDYLIKSITKYLNDIYDYPNDYKIGYNVARKDLEKDFNLIILLIHLYKKESIIKYPYIRNIKKGPGTFPTYRFYGLRHRLINLFYPNEDPENKIKYKGLGVYYKTIAKKYSFVEGTFTNEYRKIPKRQDELKEYFKKYKILFLKLDEHNLLDNYPISKQFLRDLIKNT